MDQSKTCASCRETLPEGEFSRSKRRPDGREPYCKPCRRAMHRGENPRRPDPNRPVAGPGQKVCAKCLTVKDVAEFGRGAKWSDGLFPYCRPCKRGSDNASHAKHKPKRNTAMREHYRADPEPYKRRSRDRYARMPDVVKADALRWSKSNPGRRKVIAAASARRRHEIDPERRREIWRKRHAAIRRGCAVYPFTTEQLAAKVEYWGSKCWVCGGPFEAIDHVKPLAKQGPHMLANLRPICTADNTRKRDRWPFTLMSS